MEKPFTLNSGLQYLRAIGRRIKPSLGGKPSPAKLVKTLIEGEEQHSPLSFFNQTDSTTRMMLQDDAWEYLKNHPEIHLAAVRIIRKYFQSPRWQDRATELADSLYSVSMDDKVRSAIVEFYDIHQADIDHSAYGQFKKLPKIEAALPPEITDRLKILPRDKFHWAGQADGETKYALIAYSPEENRIIFERDIVPSQGDSPPTSDNNYRLSIKIRLDTLDVHFESYDVFGYSYRVIGEHARIFNLKDPASMAEALLRLSCPFPTKQLGPHFLVCWTIEAVLETLLKSSPANFSNTDPDVQAIRDLIEFIKSLYSFRRAEIAL